MIMTKSDEAINFSEFAQRIGVSQPMVSRYVKSGQITKRSLVKSGRRTLIIPDLAVEDLKNNLDPGQLKKRQQPRYEFWDIEDADVTVRRVQQAVNDLSYVANCLTDGTLKFHLEAGLQEIVDVFNGKYENP